jgi:hypothetical protein
VEELRRAAEADELYFGCLITAAEAVDAFNASPATSGDLLDEAIRKLEHAERHPSLAAGPVEQSELKAHRLTLSGMVECLDRPFLHVGEAKIVYCYPFTMPTVDWSTIEAALGSGTTDWSLEADGRAITAESVRYMPLTDMWLYSSREQRGHRGIELCLVCPQVRGEDESDSTQPVYDVTVRLSALGNHYVRIERPLVDATLHDVYAALRGALGRGYVADGDPQWASLRTYAETAFHGLAEWLSGAGQRDGDLATPRYEEGIAAFARSVPRLVTAQDAAFYVVLLITEPLIAEPDGTRRAVRDEDLAPGSDVVGLSLLAQPVRQTVCALDEWVRYRVPDLSGRNLFSGAGFAGDLAFSTLNTTIFVRTSMPHWLLLEYVEMAEFAASLAPLLEARRTILANSRQHILTEELPALENALAGGEEIQPEVYELQSLAVEQLQAIRAEASFLRSGELVRTAVHRDFLDRVLANSRVPQLESEIMLELDRLSTMYTNVTTQARLIGARYQRREDERKAEEHRRGRNRLEIVLAVLGALTLFHVWTFVNESFKWHKVAAVVEIALTVVLILVLVLLGLRLLMDWPWPWRARRPDRHAAPASDGNGSEVRASH